MAEWRQGESRNLELTHDPTTTLNIVLILHNEGRRRRGNLVTIFNVHCILISCFNQTRRSFHTADRYDDMTAGDVEKQKQAVHYIDESNDLRFSR